jgi:hypothetical protein
MSLTHPPGADRPDSAGTLRARRTRRALPMPLHDGDLDGAAASAALARGQAEATGALGLLDLPGPAEPAAPRPLPDFAALAFRPDHGTFGADQGAARGRRTGPWPLVAAAAVAGAVLVTTPMMHQKDDKKVTGMEDLDRMVPVATLGADTGGSHALPDGGTEGTGLTDGTMPAGKPSTTKAPRTERHVTPTTPAHTPASPTTPLAGPGLDGTPPGVLPYATPLDRQMAPHNFNAVFPGDVPAPDTQPGLLTPAEPDPTVGPTIPAVPGHAGKAPTSDSPKSTPKTLPVLKPVTRALTELPHTPALPAHTEPATSVKETPAKPAAKPAKTAKPAETASKPASTQAKPENAVVEAAAKPATTTAHTTVSHAVRTEAAAKPQPATSDHTADAKPSAPPAPPAKPAAPQYGTKVVQATSVLYAGDSFSTDHVRITMTQGGNLEIGDPATGYLLWSAGTYGSGNYAVFQADGNLVVYGADGTSLWTSGSAGNDGARMVLQDDGNVVILSVSGATVWSSGTVH